MKYCTSCGKQIGDNVRFCPSCGAQQTEIVNNIPQNDSHASDTDYQEQQSQQQPRPVQTKSASNTGINRFNSIISIACLAVGVILIIWFISLGSDSPEDMLTDHVWVGEGESCEFYSNGTYFVNGYEGRWQITNDDTLIINDGDSRQYYEWETDWYVDSDSLRIKNSNYTAD